MIGRRDSPRGDGSESVGAGMATLVVNATLSRIDALAAVALAVDSTVVGAWTAEAHVPLPGGERAYVEIPRFGEPPPLAIDVISDEGVVEARTAALALQIALGQVTPWEIQPTF
ncbi:hypothetical protein [Herbiconiux sp. L3-i23]|uniref:hypothetical protein n=1 Tax=Herbiconiux sp. L3-i23 TaxID=2905871 RepID=UPI00205B36E1|nr:hypothetical protein [Herbiconiux sp. L3-i23]BDI22146.1 hypothetical protein L3i23_09220 [Herbiconiux sp. L3-i23]